jgi:hypothetical protein
MAWVVPPTFVANATLTAADLNSSLRDCMNETMPAKATTPGGFFVTTGPNTIAERVIKQDYVSTSQTRTSTTYGDLTTVGPSVTFTCGTASKVMFVVTAHISSNTTSEYVLVSYQISGATTLSPSDSYALSLESGGSSQYMALSHVSWQTLNAGSHTATLKYRVTAGTGTFLRRRLLVWPF